MMRTRSAYREPRAEFATFEEARRVAAWINDHEGRTCASYRKMHDGIFRVEAEGMRLPAFVAYLRSAGAQALNFEGIF